MTDNASLPTTSPKNAAEVIDATISLIATREFERRVALDIIERAGLMWLFDLEVENRRR